MNFSDFIDFVSNEDKNYSQFESELTNNIASLIGQEIRISFYCPQIGEHKAPNLYLTYSSSHNNTTLDEIDISDNEVYFKDFTPRLISFDEFDDRNQINPHIIVWYSAPQSVEDVIQTDKLLKFCISTFFDKYFSEIRIAIVSARLKSNDLGSYLYKLLRQRVNDRTIVDLFGAEAASIFIKDGWEPILHLRGTTGLASPCPLRDIYFHADETSYNIVKCGGKTPEPISQFNLNDGIPAGKSGEKVKSRIHSKLYWPIRLRRETSHTTSLIKHPCVGAIRLVNFQADGQDRAPFPWTKMTAVAFLAETLWVMCEGYLAIEDAAFNSDASFHGATSLMDAITKNVNALKNGLFDGDDTKSSFGIYSKKRSVDERHFVDQFEKLINVAYASARAIGYQIERSKSGFSEDKKATCDDLAAVVVRATKAMDVMKFTFSATDRVVITPPLHIISRKIPTKLKVKGSDKALFSLFANIFENCIKYRTFGEAIRINIDVRIDNGFVYYQISDNGIGVKKGEEQKIFTRGYRTESAREKAVRGNGLGLAWCREIVNFHDGSIKAMRNTRGLTIEIKLKVAKDDK